MTQAHRTTGNGYSVAVWRLDTYQASRYGHAYAIVATDGAFIPSKALRAPAFVDTYDAAMAIREKWVEEFRKTA